MQNFQKSLDLLKAGNIGADGIEKLASYTEGLSNSQLKAILSSKELTAAQRIQILTAQGMDEATAKTTLTTMGLSTAESMATTSTISLGTAFKGLFSTLLSNPIFLIGTAVTAGVSMWQSYKQSIEEAVSSASQAGQQFAENSSSLNDQIAKVQELKSALALGTLSEEESYNVKSQLLEIQKQLVDTYGEQASGIDLVNGSLSEEIDLMNKLSESEANKYLNEEKKGISEAEKQMEKNRHFYLGEFEVNTDTGKELQKIIDKYKELGIIAVEQGGLSSIAFDGNVMEADKIINDFLTEIRGLAENSDDEFGFLDGIETYAADELGKAGEIIEKHGEIYNNALNAEMITKGFGEGKPATVIEKYKDAIEDYNEALSSGDTSKIDEAKLSFDSVQDSVNQVLEQYPQFKPLFDEVGESLNNSAVQAKAFKDALNGDEYKNIVSQFKTLKDVDLKGISFDDNSIANGEEALKAVVEKAIELGIVSDDSSESVAKVVDMLIEMGFTGTQSTTALNQSFEKASDSIQKATKNVEGLKEILEESVSGSGISSENVKAFKELFGDDAEKALEKTANGYHLNQKALARLQKQQEEMAKTDYLNGLNEQYTALREIDAQLATAKLFEKDTSGLEASRNEILNNISTLEDLQYQYEAATSAYQKWIDAQSSGNERDMYENMLSGYEKVADLIERGWADSDEVRAYVDLLSGKDLSTAPVEDVIAAFERLNDTIGNSGHSILDFFTVDEDGNSTTEGIYNFFDTVNSVLGEEYAKLENGKYIFNFGEGRDKEVAKALNIDVEGLQSILRAASEAGFEINIDQPIDSIETLKMKAEEAKKSLSDIDVNIDSSNLSAVDTQIEKTQAYIKQINDLDLSPDVKADKLEYANDILEYFLTRKQELGQTENIDVVINIDESELNKGYETLGNLKGALEQINGNIVLSVDRHNAQVEINSCIAEIEAMSPEMKVALGIQGKSIEEIKTGLLTGTIQIPVSADPTQAKSDVQSVENEKVNSKNFTVTADTLQANLALTAVGRLLSGINSKEVTVTVNRVVNESKGKSGDSGSHSLSGTANIKGTAYAGGNWGNPKTQEVLVGERGVEIVVDPHTANWYTVGDNGSEFRRIPKNAIVFNHIQSKALLKNGRINGRGKALASGTAFSTGSGGVGRPSRPSSSVNDSYSSKKEESTKSSSTDKAAEKSEKASEKIIDFVEIAIKRIEEGIKRIKITAESVFKTFTKRNESLGQEMSAIVNKINVSQQAYNTYMSKANSVGLSESYASQVRNGSMNIATITDEDLSKKISDYQEWYDKAEQVKTSIMELNEELSKLAQQKFENIESEFNNRLDLIKSQQDELDSLIKLTETKGHMTSSLYYAELIKSEENSMNELVNKRNELTKSLNEAVSSGRIEEYSEAWYEMKGAIYDVNNAIVESENSLQEFQNAIRQLEWDNFDYKNDFISNTIDEGKFLIDLLSKQDLFVQKGDHKGKITNEGQAVLGQHGVNYNLEMGKADAYAKEIEKINQSLQSDPYNKDLIERRNELLELQQESILNAEEEKEAMIDLVREGIELQIEAMQDLIDKKNEALDKEKELYDYQKSIEEKSKRVKDIEKQLAAVQGDDSEENRKNIQELKQQLQEAKDDLSDAEYDKWLSDQSELMDEMMEKYDEVLNARFDDTDALISDLIDNTNANSDTINDTINSATQEVGYNITEGMKEIWSPESGIGSIISNYSNDFKTHSTSVQKYLASIESYFTEMKKKADAEANKKVNGGGSGGSSSSGNSGSNSSKPSSNSKQGNGKPDIGDAVTFTSGQYYYDSQGTSPAGSQMMGQTVYITRVNTRSWATKPYHISRDKNGSRPLGWVTASQISGYKDGTKNATKGWHLMDEEGIGTEAIVTKHGVLRQFDSGESVFNKVQVQNLHDWGMINPMKAMDYSFAKNVSANRNNNVSIDIGDVVLQGVQRPEEFANSLMHVMKTDKRVQKGVQAITTDLLDGKSVLGINHIR